MTRYILDTNIISEVVKLAPAEALLFWMAKQRDTDLFIASLTVAEVRRGILEKPRGRKRNALQNWFDGPEGPQRLFAGRVLSFDEPAALVWAQLIAAGTSSGRPRSGLDMIIAAIAAVHDCVIVTGNERHFGGVRFLNPMRDIA